MNIELTRIAEKKIEQMGENDCVAGPGINFVKPRKWLMAVSRSRVSE